MNLNRLMHHAIIFMVTMTTLYLATRSALAEPPVPVFMDDQPGLYVPMEGDPNDPLTSKPTWNFKPIDWGGEGHIQPSDNHPGPWKIEPSPFSDAAATCRGNEGPTGEINRCVNSTRRYNPTFKNPVSSDDKIPMDTTRDWLFTVSFAIENTDTFGTDKLFEFAAATRGASPNRSTEDLLAIKGAYAEEGDSSTLPGGLENRYRIIHGPWLDGQPEPYGTVIDQPLTQGKITVHYKAANQRLDFWFDDELILADFESLSGTYDINFVQLGGGGTSFENALWDELYIGVLSETAACGTDGPGTNIPGDFNCDGLVDVADLGIIGANFNGTEVTYINGDANLDGSVDVADLGIVGANWGIASGTSLSQAPNGAELAALLPEPATAITLIIGLTCLGRNHRQIPTTLSSWQP